MRCRYVKRNHRTKTPNKVVSFCTAYARQMLPSNDNVFAIVPIVTAALFRNRRDKNNVFQDVRFYDSTTAFHADLWSFCGNKSPVTCFTHSAGIQLPSVRFFELADEGFYNIRYLIDSDPPTIVEAYRDRTKVKFLDIRNYLDLSIETLYEAKFGAAMQLEPTTIGLAENTEWARECLLTIHYWALDLLDFVDKHDLGNFRPTISSQAMQAYRHRFGIVPDCTGRVIDETGKDIPQRNDRIYPLTHDVKEVLELDKRSIFQAETNCFYVGPIHNRESMEVWLADKERIGTQPTEMGPIYKLDVNSLYPSVMKYGEQPYRLDNYGDRSAPERLKELVADFHVVADVALDVNFDTFPKKIGERVYYINGRFSTTLCGDELKYALDAGVVDEVHQWASYRKWNLFWNYIDYFYDMKTHYAAAQSKPFYLLCKMLMNGLFGKFAQQSIKWSSKPDTECLSKWGRWYELDIQTDKVSRWRGVAGHSQLLTAGEPAAWTFPAITASICAAAQRHMRSLRDVAGKVNVFYQGCDSLLVNQKGYDSLTRGGWIDATSLGRLRLEGMYDQAEITNVRNYSVGNKRVLAGVKANHTFTTEGKYQYFKTESLRSYLDTFRKGHLTENVVVATLNSRYSGGEILPSGWVKPFNQVSAKGEYEASKKPIA